MGYFFAQLFVKFIGVTKTIVTNVNVVLKGKGDFSALKVIFGDGRVHFRLIRIIAVA